jgi:hypothetical protein
MTELLIRSLRATVPAVEDVPGLGGRVRSMLRRMAELRLDDALAELDLPAGEWCVRRLDVLMPLSFEDTDASIERQWAGLLATALRTALASGSPEVIRYPRPDDALDDLVGELAAGRAGRAWAWRQLGLLDDAEPAAAPGEALVAALRRRPEAAAAALVRYLHRDGIAAPHRMLGSRGWQQLAAIAATAAGVPAETLSRPEPEQVQPDAGRTERARAVVARSELASAVRRGGLRPDTGTARAWAVLTVAEADPAQLRRPDAAALVTEVAELLAPDQPGATGFLGRSAETGSGRPAETRSGRPAAGRPVPSTGRPDAVHRSPTGSSAAAEPAAGPASATPPPAAHSGGATEPPQPAGRAIESSEQPDESPTEREEFRRTATTGWAGLLFLLATASEAGVPDALLEDEALAGRTLRWALHRIGLLLIPAAADDPAVLCFAGLSPFDPPPAGEPATPAEQAALARHARRWATATLARLGKSEDDELLLALARRRAVILADPGWIELWLELAEVDVQVRCAGLDIDPGWLPWLGVVVRYRYG